MYGNAVPVFEMKNKLSFFLHKVEEEGPVFISNRGRTAFVLQTVEDYEKQTQTAPKEKNIFEVMAELRQQYEITEDDFDFSAHLQKLREEEPYYGRESAEYLFDGI